MRIGNLSEWMNSQTDDFKNELYDPKREYDVVILVKGVSPEFLEVARAVKKYGSKVIYDANVNYWEVWGDYSESSPKPTIDQQNGIRKLMDVVDFVVADSSYLAKVASKYHPRVQWIPDNVNLNIYSHQREHEYVPRLRLVWSGMSHKADHLLLIHPTLIELANRIELIIVSDRKPKVFKEFAAFIPTKFIKFSDHRYAKILSSCDVIISPKNLRNAYDLCHTEYKITLGMATGLPAVASPQQSYVEAIQAKSGGFIAFSPDDWLQALNQLFVDIQLRRAMGSQARLTVIENYSTEVVAKQYADVIREVVKF